MEFLKRAEQYAEVRGDGDWFKNIYTELRQFNDVKDSVWKTIQYLYGSFTADVLELQQ